MGGQRTREGERTRPRVVRGEIDNRSPDGLKYVSGVIASGPVIQTLYRIWHDIPLETDDN